MHLSFHVSIKNSRLSFWHFSIYNYTVIIISSEASVVLTFQIAREDENPSSGDGEYASISLHCFSLLFRWLNPALKDKTHIHSQDVICSIEARSKLSRITVSARCIDWVGVRRTGIVFFRPYKTIVNSRSELAVGSSLLRLSWAWASTHLSSARLKPDEESCSHFRLVGF